MSKNNYRLNPTLIKILYKKLEFSMYNKNLHMDTHRNLFKCLNLKNIKPFRANILETKKIIKEYSKISLQLRILTNQILLTKIEIKI